MSKCANCWHADRDPETGRREVIEKPDYTAQNLKPGQEPPKVRTVKSCAVGMRYYKTFGAYGEHNCKKFEEASEHEDAAQQALEEAAADFELTTSRYKLPDTGNSLVLIQVMAEDNNEAFDILTDAMAAGMAQFADIITNLNDMNIRGEQIVTAYRWCRCTDDPTRIEALRRFAVARDKEMVKAVNKLCDNDITGPAVERFAAEFGHHDRDTTKASGGRGKGSGAGSGRNKAKGARGVRILRKKTS